MEYAVFAGAVKQFVKIIITAKLMEIILKSF